MVLGHRAVRTAAFLFLFLLIKYVAAGSQDMERRTAATVTQNRRDPLGKLDSFLSLSPREQSEWGFASSRSLQEMQETLRNLQTRLIVDVRLVGFDGEGSEGLQLTANDVAWHLQALKPKLEAASLQYLGKDMYTKNELGININIIHQVSKVRPELGKQIEAAIANAVNADIGQSPQKGVMSLISYEVVDKILEAHSRESGALHTIYILNPRKAANSYAYLYGSREHCAGTLWTGLSQRYLWIDLTAGPVTYGPVEALQGRVLPHSFPRVDFYRPAYRAKAIAPELSAMVHSATKHLIAPGTMGLYLKDWTTIRIQIIHVHDTMNPSKAIQEVGEYDLLNTEFGNLALKGQSVLIEHFYVGFGHCDVCVAAYGRSLKTRTERIPGAGMHVASTTFLDRVILYAWLSDETFLRRLKDNQGKSIQLFANPPHRIVPVFIFELTSLESLTFDGRKSVVSFPDMVIGVRTYGGSGSSGFSCNEKNVPLQTVRIIRPLAAALLQTGWGIMDTAESIGEGDRGIEKNYMWSVGNTVFGHLAGIASLSFSQKDAGRRNTIFARIHTIVAEADMILRGFDNVSSTGYVTDTLPAKGIPLFFQRWNFLLFKLNSAMTYLGSLQFDEAWYFARSSIHEVDALVELAQMSADSVSTVLECGKKRGDLKLWLFGFFGIGVALVLWVLRKLGPKKKKKF